MDKKLNKYKSNLISLIDQIDISIIKETINKLDKCHTNKNKIYIIGNGGSAATASHMVNDLGVGLARRNIRYFNIECLSDNTSVISALSNDIGYENIFLMQLKNKIGEGDILIAISCSGNSNNIIHAVKYAKEHHATIIGLTGFDGGKLKKLSDINYHIETAKNQYGLVEDLHMIFNHMIYTHYIKLEEK